MTMKCYSCHGTKKLLSLGNIVKECPTCKGVGYVASVDTTPITHQNDTVLAQPIPIAVKQRGRPKQQVIDKQ